MNQDVERVRKNIRSIIITAMLDVLAMMAIGVGIAAKVGNPQSRLIADEGIVNFLLGGGIALALWCGLRLFRLAREHGALRSALRDAPGTD